MRNEPVRFEELMQRIRDGYRNTPGLRLTLAQAQRLWGLDRDACTVVLNALIDERFLRRKTDGRYTRAEPRAANNSVA